VWQRLPLRAVSGATSLFSAVGGLTGCGPFSLCCVGLLRCGPPFCIKPVLGCSSSLLLCNEPLRYDLFYLLLCGVFKGAAPPCSLLCKVKPLQIVAVGYRDLCL
jgi:hypothetical protein